MKSINELEFTCPHCGSKTNIIEWLSAGKLDDEWILENLSEDGVLRLSYPYMQCGCDAEYIVDIEQGYVTIYDDRNEIVYEEGYGVKKE